MSDYWESIFASREWGAYPSEELVRFVARNVRSVPDRSKIRILEVGCGPGANLWYLVREGFVVAGIDCSPTAIHKAAERLAHEGLPCRAPAVDLRVGSFPSLPWPDQHFDIIVDIEALYGNPLDTIRLTVAEIRRTLRDKGRFFGKMFGVLTTGSATGEVVEPGTRSRPVAGPCAGNEIAHFFTRSEIQALFSDFTELSIDHVHRTDANGSVDIFEWLVAAQK